MKYNKKAFDFAVKDYKKRIKNTKGNIYDFTSDKWIIAHDYIMKSVEHFMYKTYSSSNPLLIRFYLRTPNGLEVDETRSSFIIKIKFIYNI